MTSQSSSVLPETFTDGPLGLGDPNDRRLRKVEIEILIPKLMREVAKREKCAVFAKEFEECGKAAGLAIVLKCRAQNNRLKECLTKWYNDDDFKRSCTEQYLKERAEFRKTGIKQKLKRM